MKEKCCGSLGTPDLSSADRGFLSVFSRISLALGIVAALALGFYFLRFSFSAGTSFFDSYEFLNNAKAIAGADVQYATRRPPAPSLMVLPFLAAFAGSPAAEQTVSFVVSVFTALASVFVIFLISRRAAPCYFAMLTLPFLVLNRILVHYTPFPLGDVPGMLFAGLSAYSLLASGGKRGLIMSGIWAGLSAASKYHNGIICPALFLAAVMCGRDGDPELDLRGRLGFYGRHLIVLPFMVFFAANMAAYTGMHGAGPVHKVEMLFRAIYRGFGYSSIPGVTDPWNEYLVYLWMVLPKLALAAGITGIFASLRRRSRADVLMLLILGVYFFALSFKFKHNEARYMLPLFIPLYYFIAAGLAAFWGFLAARLSRSLSRAVFVLLFLVALAGISTEALKEIRLFDEPFFSVPWEREVSEKIAAGGGSVFWAGSFLPLRPKGYLFHRLEEYYSVFHFAPHVVWFYTGVMPQALPYTWGNFTSSMAPEHRSQPMRAGDRIVCVVPQDDRALYITTLRMSDAAGARDARKTISVHRMPDGDSPAREMLVAKPSSAGKEFYTLIYWLSRAKGFCPDPGPRIMALDIERVPVP